MKVTSIILLMLTLLTGCATTTIKVVDEKGKPIEGALVISEQPPYIMQSWKLGLYFTNAKGKAKVVSGGGHIFKPGYFPVIDGSELDRDMLWIPHSNFAPVTSIYPIKNNQKIPISITSYTTQPATQTGVFEVPVDVCGSIRVIYNSHSSHFRVTSKNNNIIPSSRFYFVGASNKRKVFETESDYNIAFYCTENSNLYKVGISLSENTWRLDGPNHKLTILTAKVSSTEDYLQPTVNCLAANKTIMDNFGLYGKGKLNVYASPAVIEQLESFKHDISCSNQDADKIFKDIKRFLKNADYQI